jgi:hypothetical protein
VQREEEVQAQAEDGKKAVSHVSRSLLIADYLLV